MNLSKEQLVAMVRKAFSEGIDAGRTYPDSYYYGDTDKVFEMTWRETEVYNDLGKVLDET